MKLIQKTSDRSYRSLEVTLDPPGVSIEILDHYYGTNSWKTINLSIEETKKLIEELQKFVKEETKLN
jgi:hypothetical protein